MTNPDGEIAPVGGIDGRPAPSDNGVGPRAMNGRLGLEPFREDAMSKVFPLRRPVFKGFAMLLALGVLQAVVAGDTSPSTSAAARVSRLAQNVERAESVRAVKRLQETYAQYPQFGLWTDMAALFSDNAQLSYGKDHGTRAPGDREVFPRKVWRGHTWPEAGRSAHADGPAAARQRLGRRPEREGSVVGILHDGAARRESRVGGRHLRERVRA